MSSTIYTRCAVVMSRTPEGILQQWLKGSWKVSCPLQVKAVSLQEGVQLSEAFI